MLIAINKEKKNDPRTSKANTLALHTEESSFRTRLLCSSPRAMSPVAEGYRYSPRSKKYSFASRTDEKRKTRAGETEDKTSFFAVFWRGALRDPWHASWVRSVSCVLKIRLTSVGKYGIIPLDKIR